VKKNVVVTAAAALLTIIGAAPAIAQGQTEGILLNPARARAALQQGSATQTAPQTPVAQLPAQAPAGPSVKYVTPGPRVDLTIEDAVARARDKNIDIGVARITPRLSDFSISSLEANYRPNVTSQVFNRSATTAVTNQTQGGTGDSQHTGTVSWQGGLAQNLFFHGGSWNLNWTNTRVDTSNLFAVRNPTYNSGLTGGIVQPLLRGWRIDSTRASLQTTRISQQNDEISLQATIATTDANTRNAYWDLVYAIQAVDAAQETLDISNTLVSQNQQRVEIGTLAPIDIKSAQAEAANNRLALVQAQANVRTAELALKRLVVSGTDDPLWTSSINPVDRPGAVAEPINVEAATARALRERTDLQQSVNNLKISDINLKNQVEATRPQLDFQASYGLAGIGGTQFERNNQLGGTIVNTIPGNYFDALSTLGGFNLPTWSVQVNFSMPIGLSAAQSNVARSKLSVEQSQANLKALQLQIATDVANAALNVQSSLESVQASQTARELSKEKLDATQSKLDVGMATNYDVVQAQRDYSTAQDNELRAMANYRKALVNFEAVQTTGTRSVGAAVGAGGTTGTTGGTATSTSGSGSTGGSGGSPTGSGGTGGGGL